MATIDYKEKLRLAKEALESGSYDKETIEYIFPELAESEDEKMRAMAIKAVYAPQAQSCIKSWGINPDDVIAWLEKQGKTYPILSNSPNIGKVEQKPTNEVEPKFKVKYAGSEYNVLEVKDIAGVTFYVIEDEPNHIDYVKPENCEIVPEQNPTDKVDQHSLPVSDDSSLPTFDESIYHPCSEKAYEQKPAEWSEWDRILQDSSISYLCNLRDTFETKGWDKEQIQKCINWLKSLRPQNRWKPTDEQISVLEFVMEDIEKDSIRYAVLNSVLEQLKKLREV